MRARGVDVGKGAEEKEIEGETFCASGAPQTNEETWTA
jgi:hypothetical protein